jgi:hypothetical protein
LGLFEAAVVATLKIMKSLWETMESDWTEHASAPRLDIGLGQIGRNDRRVSMQCDWV